MSEVSATVGSLEGGGGKPLVNWSYPCVRKRAVSHHVFRVWNIIVSPSCSLPPGRDGRCAGQMRRCGVVVRRGNRRALAYPPRWGADERRLLGAPDGSPLQLQALSPFRLPSSLLLFHGGHGGSHGLGGGPFSILHCTNKPFSHCVSCSVCVVCASLASVRSRPPRRSQ